MASDMDRSESPEILTERDNNCAKIPQLLYEICLQWPFNYLFIYLFIYLLRKTKFFKQKDKNNIQN
jgi:hypothetical protein